MMGPASRRLMGFQDRREAGPTVGVSHLQCDSGSLFHRPHTSQISTVVSALPEASKRPSGEKARERTAP